MTLVGSESALISGELAFVIGLALLGIFDRPSLLVRSFNRLLLELNR
jgi:hypothetical protein